MIVTVTQEDIDKAERGTGWACPVARAMQRAGVPDPYAGKMWLSQNGSLDGADALCETPAEVATFIDRYDRYLPVEPFSFEIPDPTAPV